MLISINKFDLKCKECNMFLTDELYCIKCKERISGDYREKLLDFYKKFKITKHLGELYHITPNHQSIMYYDMGCVSCDEKISNTLSIVLDVNTEVIPEYSEFPKEFYKIFKWITRQTILNIEIESETIDSDQ